MSLKEKLTEDLKAAMRARDEARLRTIRALRAALMEREIAERKGGEATLTPEQELEVLQKEAKRRREAIEQFRAAGREDLVQKEAEELKIIEEYLPRQLSDDEIRAVLEEIIEAVGARSVRDMGRVMKEAMARMRGQADGRRVSELARELLSRREAAS
ncbi:GatB/YqeY domain-containing protein [Rhodothermus marinus]|uniref:GatB/YqeY domain-containing protein n=1 Tax=Rhodothermus marinus TaxID=29549 RepID=UPI0012BA4650|nr:GatB/YqeY domain-containing protein [Rhodothermus marinus]BBM70049.1 aspartyl-tRNA amidotransferase subunit B [Rhodothermus marinus]BBM73034.1 aspartyl-tRNA amidotransferase subunit B [Rhodothermus marinus]